MDILGISSYYHDSAAAVVRDGEIIAAAQEERFTRKKHDAGFPGKAIAYCVAASGTRIEDFGQIVFYDKPLVKFEHAASAFYPSPFQDAAVLCMDGVGEWATTSAWLGSGNRLTPLWEIPFPHSIGPLYSAFTYYTGFKVNSGEYKVMGLAPYGAPGYVKLIYEGSRVAVVAPQAGNYASR